MLRCANRVKEESSVGVPTSAHTIGASVPRPSVPGASRRERNIASAKASRKRKREELQAMVDKLDELQFEVSILKEQAAEQDARCARLTIDNAMLAGRNTVMETALKAILSAYSDKQTELLTNVKTAYDSRHDPIYDETWKSWQAMEGVSVFPLDGF